MKDEMVNLGERLENSLENLRLQGGESNEKGKLQSVSSNILDTRPCLTTFPNNVKRVENKTRSGVFLTTFEVFGNVVKHCFEWLIIS